MTTVKSRCDYMPSLTEVSMSPVGVTDVEIHHSKIHCYQICISLSLQDRRNSIWMGTTVLTGKLRLLAVLAMRRLAFQP
jgi:hypothetical protein